MSARLDAVYFAKGTALIRRTIEDLAQVREDARGEERRRIEETLRRLERTLAGYRRMCGEEQQPAAERPPMPRAPVPAPTDAKVLELHLPADPCSPRSLRHIVEIAVESEAAGEVQAMCAWCTQRFGLRGWTRVARADRTGRFAQFRFREPRMAEAFERAFRSAGPVRCRS